MSRLLSPVIRSYARPTRKMVGSAKSLVAELARLAGSAERRLAGNGVPRRVGLQRAAAVRQVGSQVGHHEGEPDRVAAELGVEAGAEVNGKRLPEAVAQVVESCPWPVTPAENRSEKFWAKVRPAKVSLTE